MADRTPLPESGHAVQSAAHNMTMLVRPPAFLELDSMERRLRRMLEGIGFVPTLIPAADLYETEKQWVVELEVPGYEEKELTIEISDHWSQ